MTAEGKKLIIEQTKFRMKVVDEHESIREIEDTLKSGMVELLIIHAHKLVKLIRILKEWQPWNQPTQHEEPGSDSDVDLNAIFKEVPKYAPPVPPKPGPPTP